MAGRAGRRRRDLHRPAYAPVRAGRTAVAVRWADAGRAPEVRPPARRPSRSVARWSSAGLDRMVGPGRLVPLGVAAGNADGRLVRVGRGPARSAAPTAGEPARPGGSRRSAPPVPAPRWSALPSPVASGPRRRGRGATGECPRWTVRASQAGRAAPEVGAAAPETGPGDGRVGAGRGRSAASARLRAARVDRSAARRPARRPRSGSVRRPGTSRPAGSASPSSLGEQPPGGQRQEHEPEGERHQIRAVSLHRVTSRLPALTWM